MTTNPQHGTGDRGRPAGAGGSGDSERSGDSGDSGRSGGAGGTRPSMPMPREPEDVDSLLAETLRAESEEHFTWKEPERRPRWYERVEQQSPAATAAAASTTVSTAGTGTGARRNGPHIRQLLVGVACLLLALWCLAALVLGVVLDPVVVLLGLCTLGGLALIVAGLAPRRRRRRL